MNTPHSNESSPETPSCAFHAGRPKHEALEPHLLRLVEQATGDARATGTRRLASLWGGFGALHRVELAGSSSATVVVKHVRTPPVPALSSPEETRSRARKIESYEVERRFYSHGVVVPGARTPRAHLAARLGDDWLFVLDDLDRAGFPRRPRRVTNAEVELCLSWLARFHAHFLAAIPGGLWPTGTYFHLATRPDELARLRHPLLRRLAEPLDRLLGGARFRTCVHGDAKLENFCFSSTPDAGEVAAVDFQYVGGGVGVQDVAYFLSSCLAPRDCEELVPIYLDRYFVFLADALASRDVEFTALEAEWRELFPVAWVDFYRFWLGWTHESTSADPFSEKLTRELGARLRPPRSPNDD